jgi:hypothetical protein
MVPKTVLILTLIYMYLLLKAITHSNIHLFQRNVMKKSTQINS